MGLQQFERRLERLVEGVFAKAFRSGLEPVEVGRRITREMDLGRTVGVRGAIAPNRFVVALSPADHERLSGLSQSLLRDLADYAREHARTEGYQLVGPVVVELEVEPGLGAGETRVVGTVLEGPGGGPTGSLVLPDGSRTYVGDEPLSIGRSPDCDVVLNEREVSRRHAEIRRHGDGFAIVDLGSTNGTRVNGRVIPEGGVELIDGDDVRVGTSTMRFEAS